MFLLTLARRCQCGLLMYSWLFRWHKITAYNWFSPVFCRSFSITNVCVFWQADFPSVAGLIEDLDCQMDADDISGQGHKEKKYYIDTVNIKIPRKGMEMTGFLRDGMGKWCNKYSLEINVFCCSWSVFGLVQCSCCNLVYFFILKFYIFLQFDFVLLFLAVSHIRINNWFYVFMAASDLFYDFSTI